MGHRTSLADFFTGFSQGYDTTNKMLSDSDLAKVENTAPQDVYQYATDSDLAQVGPRQDGDTSQGSATSQHKYKLFDQEQDTPFTKEQINDAKAAQRASVYRRYGMSDKARQEDEGIDQRKTRDLVRQEAQNQIGLSSIKLQEAQHSQQQEQSMEQARNAVTGKWREKLVDQQGQPRPPTDSEMIQIGADQTKALWAAGLTKEAQDSMLKTAQSVKAYHEATDATRKELVSKAIQGIDAGTLDGVKQLYDDAIPDGGHVAGLTRDAKGNVVIQSVDAGGNPRQPIVVQGGLDGLKKAVRSMGDPNAAFNLTMQGLQLKKVEQEIAASKASVSASGASAAASSAMTAERTATTQRESEKWNYDKNELELKKQVEETLKIPEAKRTPEQKQLIESYKDIKTLGQSKERFSGHDDKDLSGRTNGLFILDKVTGQPSYVPADQLRSNGGKPGLGTVASGTGGAPAAPGTLPPPSQREVGKTVINTAKGQMVWSYDAASKQYGWAPTGK
jgi:hypothetical protein